MNHRSLLAPMVLAALLLPSVAGARLVRVACRDGVPPLPILCPTTGCRRPPCDVDVQCNGTCSFALRTCDDASCTDRTDAVPVGRKAVTQAVITPGGRPTTFVLRCRAHAGPIPCSSSTTTTTVATSTTTTQPGQPCQTDGDCGTASFCSVPRCLNGTCGYVCICAGPLGAPTCCPGPAAACAFTTTTTTIPSCIPFFASGCAQTSDCCQPCLNGTIAPCAVCLQGVCEGAP